MGAGVIGFCYSWWVLTQAAGYQPSADSHYHFTAARYLLRHGPWPSPATGLPFTVFAQLPVDHYWGLHVLLTPFAAISDYSLGLKLAAAVGFSIVFAALAAFFARRQVSHPIAWALLCGLFSNQDWRYLQLRGAQLLLVLEGKAEPLLTGFAASADANLSFDGKRVLFAGKQAANDPWQIWEMTLADRSVRKLTTGKSDAHSGIPAAAEGETV